MALKDNIRTLVEYVLFLINDYILLLEGDPKSINSPNL